MLCALLLVALLAAPGDTDDDTLRFYLSTSSLVVAGTILETPLGVSSETGVMRYGFKFRADKVLKGKLPEKEIYVHLTRYEMGAAERPAYLREGGKAILFLRRGFNRAEFKSWRSADGWFGIQPYNTVMEASLEQVASEE